MVIECIRAAQEYKKLTGKLTVKDMADFARITLIQTCKSWLARRGLISVLVIERSRGDLLVVEMRQAER